MNEVLLHRVDIVWRMASSYTPRRTTTQRMRTKGDASFWNVSMGFHRLSHPDVQWTQLQLLPDEDDDESNYKKDEEEEEDG